MLCRRPVALNFAMEGVFAGLNNCGLRWDFELVFKQRSKVYSMSPGLPGFLGAQRIALAVSSYSYVLYSRTQVL